jgi:starvation-inducible outer membrane lipoprotein
VKHASIITAALLLAACDVAPQDSNKVQADQQERILQEGTAQTGMPSVSAKP